MTYASKAMSMTMLDLFESPKLVNEVKAEYKERKGDVKYEAVVPPGPPPVNQGE